MGGCGFEFARGMGCKTKGFTKTKSLGWAVCEVLADGWMEGGGMGGWRDGWVEGWVGGGMGG